ncbi:MAG: hypothetical protein EZS28_029105 [Streblomastix strix]|uniref:Uncharacterized protein n=1 Tax=Streblomastix strix TaxID=222440 RepID=A0A5J4UYT3_9EUKA|nr:MAG: hypothetical protein EZS28_029105 [Streblomastix strix]
MPQSRNELAISKPLHIVQPMGPRAPSIGLANGFMNAAGKPKLLPSAGSIESGIRPTSYVLPFKPFDLKYRLNTHILQVPSSTIQNVLYADIGKKSFIIN